MSCKPKPSREAPWGAIDGPSDFTTTNRSSFTNLGAPRPPKMVDYKKPQHEWHSDAPFENRSTSRDTFTNMFSRPPQSFKPRHVYEPSGWDHQLTTTASAHFVKHPSLQRSQSCRKPWTPVDWLPEGARFDCRSTSQDAFSSFGPVPRTPAFRPNSRESSRTLYPEGYDRSQSFSHIQTTSQATYRPHAKSSFAKIRTRDSVVGSSGRW